MATKKKAGSKAYKTPASVAKALLALPPEAARTPPGLPVAEALFEAADLAVHAAKHRAALARVMDNAKLIAALEPRAEHLRVTQQRWRAARAATTGVDTALRERAEHVREELFHAARYILRKDPAAQRQLDAISAGDGLADLVDDLFALASLVADEPALFAKAKVQGMKKVPEGARALAESLERALSAERDDSVAWEALAERNRAAVLLAEAVDEVRAAGRFALRGTKDRRHFQSAYIRRKAARQRETKKAKAATTVA